MDAAIKNHPDYPRLLRLLADFQKQPASTLFAPLADCYRKVGLLDDAIQTYEDGLKQHRDFRSAIVGLARCLFEKKDYVGVRQKLAGQEELLSDNVAAVSLMARSLEELGILGEACSFYERLVYLLPFDEKIRKKYLAVRSAVERIQAPPSQDPRGQLKNWKVERPGSTFSTSNQPSEKRQASSPATGQESSRLPPMDSRERQIRVLQGILGKLESLRR